MTLTVSQLAANEASLSIPIAGETLNLVYYPNKFTTKLLLHIDVVYDGEREALGIHETLAALIKSWDLQDDNGNPYPLDPEKLAELGIPLLRKISQAIGNDTRPN